MNKDDLMFEYPIDDEYENDRYALINNIKNKRKDNKITVTLLLALLISLILFNLPFFKSVSFVFVLITVLSLVGLYFKARHAMKYEINNYVRISAYSEYMMITHYNNNKRKELKVKYSTITDARFSEKYHRFQIAFINDNFNLCEVYDAVTNEKLSCEIENLFSFPLGDNSYPQYFFFYIAENFFTINDFHKTKKWFKKYGNQNEYYDNLVGEEEV